MGKGGREKGESSLKCGARIAYKAIGFFLYWAWRFLNLGDTNTKIEDLKVEIKEFLRERDWEKFQNPKDLAEGICVEAAELLQLFQWMSSEEVRTFKDNSSNVERLKEELADVAIYCLGMANAMNIDLTSSVLRKLENNRKKYPAKLYRGKAHL